MSTPPWGERLPDVMGSGSVKHSSGITYRTGDINDARAFEWAWKDRILLGYLNLLVGEEGVGKGNLASWFLARVTRGELPGNLLGKPRNVAVIGDEDSFQNIWGPRLHAAGADLDRIFHIESVEDGVLDVRDDSGALAKFIAAKKIAVVYFDQLLDNLGYTDNWKDKQVREALAPLRRAARETNVAGVLTLHPNKRGGSFRDRVSGTPAFNALSRSSLLVAKHPQDPARVVAVRAKGNYAVEPAAFEFTIEGVDLKVGNSKRRTLSTSLIADVRETSLRAADVLDAKTSRRRDDSKAGRARQALASLFVDGQPRKVADVQKKLFKLHGFDPNTLGSAATALGFKRWQEGFPTTWWWAPGDGASDDE
jgi:hypothetical protein